MSKQIVLIMILFLWLPCLLYAGTSDAEVKSPNGYPVHNLDTGLNYTSIQEAINAPETLDGHTVFVEEGTYYEHVTVSKSLTLLGEDREVTIIDGNMIGNVVWITRDHVNIRGFTIRRSGQGGTNSGIYVGSTRYCDISANCIVDNEYGVHGFPRNMSITDNTIEGNFLGVDLNSGSTGNVISRNHLVANYVSVHLNLADANYILQNNMTNNSRSVTLWESKNNTLYHNNFLNNTFGSVTAADLNFLDNGFEGNYWSNYTGVDLNHDGIGDSPYVIDENHTDHYPLMGMFSDFNATSEYHVQTICNSTISDFQFSGIAISFNVTGVDGTAGFCRICIPTVLMNGTYHVFVNGTEVSCNLLSCSNETYSFLYFNYTHSTQKVIIVPEFPSFFIPPVLMITTLLAIVIYKKRTKASRRHFCQSF